MTIVALLNKTRLAFIAFFLLLLLVLPLVDPDYFWHLKTGEYIVLHRALPAGDIFSSTRFGQAWVLHEWLFEVVLYAMFEWLGAPGVKLLTVALAMSALGIVFALARRLGQSPALAFILTVVALIPFSSGISARPQLVTYILFAAYLYILLSYKYHQARLSLVALPLLMLVWVNAHGGYVIGIALTGLFTAGEWIVYWMGQGRDPAQRQRLVRLTQLACATVLASLANPGFLEHWLYPFQVLGMQANERIQEWKSANFHEFGPRAYLMLVLLFLLSCTYAVRKPDFTEIVIPLFFLVNGFIALRHIPLAVLVLIPFTALAFSRGALVALSALWQRSTFAKRYKQDTAGSKQLGQGEYVLNWLVLGMIVISLALGEPGFRAREKESTAAALPVDAAAFVAAAGISGNMFNSYNYGGYLIYRLSPQRKVFIDGRADVYGDRFIGDFLDIYEGRAGWKGKFDKLSIDFAIVGKDAPIRQLLLAEASFKEVYLDLHHAVLLRNAPKRQPLPGN